MKVELDLFNYATKADLKNATGVDTSDFAKMTYLCNSKSDVNKLDIDKLNSKSDVNKLDIDKLKTVPSNLSNLKSKEDKLDIGKLETTPVD